MQIDIIGQRLALRVHAQDCLASLQIGGFNRNLSVETARTQEGGLVPRDGAGVPRAPREPRMRAS